MGVGALRDNMKYALHYLDYLEAESIYILRETAAIFEKPVLLFSGGKDSLAVLFLARKAFYPATLPFSLLHVDTGHNFPETIAFRDRLMEEYKLDLIVHYVQDSIDRGLAKEEEGKFPSRNSLQSVTLLDAIEELDLDACIGGARRDEEKARAKERVFSIRDQFGQWEPRRQRPELWELYNGRIHKGENVRVFPLSNWTELDVWHYIQRERIPVPKLYFKHMRDTIIRQGQVFPVSAYIQIDKEATRATRKVRFRTVGDMTCTAAVESEAGSIAEIIAEIGKSTITERGARLDDRRSESAMEDRKRAGYF